MNPFSFSEALAALASFRSLVEFDYYGWADAEPTDKIGSINGFEVLWCVRAHELQWLDEDGYGYGMSLADGSIIEY